MSLAKNRNRKLRKLLGPEWRTITAQSPKSYLEWMEVAKDRRNGKKLKPNLDYLELDAQ